MKYVGKPMPLVEAKEKVTGKTIYTDDMKFPNMLYGKILYSTVPHAKIISIDTSAAEVLPGVEAVITHLDSPNVKYNSIIRYIDDELPNFPKTVKVMDNVVRYVGDTVAAVAATTPEIAAKALRLIKVQYEDLPAVYEVEEAIKDGAYPIHPGGNIIKDTVTECGDVDVAMGKAEHVFESVVTTPMVHHGYIEPVAVTAYWTVNNKLMLWSPNHMAYSAMFLLSNIFGLPCSDIQIFRTNVGGSFGAKVGMILEPIAAILSKKTGQHVRIVLDRKESMVSTCTRVATKIYMKTGVNKEGKIVAQDMKVYLNAGPHSRVTPGVQDAMCGKLFKLYRIPNMRFHGISAFTNTPLASAMRGFGSPQGIAAMEIQMDKIAKALGIDPVEFRRRNFVHPQDIDPLAKVSIGNARVLDCLNKGAAEFKWEERKLKKNSENTESYKYGCGVAGGLHGNGVAPFFPDMTSMTLHLHEDGTVILNTGLCDLGTGTYTILPQIIGEILDIEPRLISVDNNNTVNSPYDYGASASRNTWVGGNAAIKLAKSLRDKLIVCAAEMFSVNAEDIIMEDGYFKTKEGNKIASRKELIIYAFMKKRMKFTESIDYCSTGNAGSYGTHFAYVKVDTKTGEVKVLDYVAVCDVGRAINPMLLEGQIEGGIQMGMGLALYEELKLDTSTGKITNASFKRYRMAKAKDMPAIKIFFVEEGEEKGPFGAKSIGEAATVPVAPAIVNAINDALGSEFTNLPVTSDKILAFLKKE